MSRKKPVAYSHPRKTSPEVVGKILELRSAYEIGALRIAYYLDRYHGIKISESMVTRVLRAHEVGSLPAMTQRRNIAMPSSKAGEPIFAIDAVYGDDEWGSPDQRSIQATCWEIRLEQVRKATPFVGAIKRATS